MNTNTHFNFKSLTDSHLMQKTNGFVKEEREVLTNLLHCFREIERRRLYCDYKFSSLHKMLVGHFGYSDDEAYRRISAMRLLKDIPEVEEKITRGELSLSHLALAQSFFQKEAKVQKLEVSKSDKLDLLSKIGDESIREAQRIVLSQSKAPQELRPDKVTVISDNKLEYRFTADHSLENEIQEVKGLLAHKYSSLSMSELLEVLCDFTIKTLKNKRSVASRKPRGNTPTLSMNHLNSPSQSNNVKSVAQVRFEVWRESGHQCQNCKSTYALEIDHRFPKAKGGTNTKENFRVLCRACNQRSAIREFGQKKMDLYLNLIKDPLIELI